MEKRLEGGNDETDEDPTQDCESTRTPTTRTVWEMVSRDKEYSDIVVVETSGTIVYYVVDRVEQCRTRVGKWGVRNTQGE